ncbi:MAG: Mg2+/Co2+ transporter CorB [Bacteriovoracaceae bacterium]
MADTYLLISIIACLVLSGFFSGSETALLKLNLKKLDRDIIENPTISLQALKELTKSTSKLLVTILLGNNIVNIFGTAAASSLAVTHFGEEKGLIVATTVMTVSVLIFSEILPKTIAANNSTMVSKLVSLPLFAFHKILTPVHWVFNNIIDRLIKVFQASDDGDTGPSSYEELMFLAKEVKPHPKRKGTTPIKVIGGAAKSSEITLSEIMINRAKINFCPVEADVKTTLNLLLKDQHTRLPVFEGSVDNIVGIIHLKDVVIAQDDPNFSLKDKLHPAFTFSGKTKLFTALTTMQSKFSHMAIIKDEFGVTLGLVTLEDLLEEIVGEIRDEFDAHEVDQIKKINEKEFLVNSPMLVSDFNRRVNLKIKAEKGETLSGLLFNRLDGQVEVGTKLNDGSFEFEVVKIEKQIIKELLVRVL